MCLESGCRHVRSSLTTSLNLDVISVPDWVDTTVSQWLVSTDLLCPDAEKYQAACRFVSLHLWAAIFVYTEITGVEPTQYFCVLAYSDLHLYVHHRQ